GIPQIKSFTDYAHPERYSYFCDVNIPVKWNLVIYMDINACLACTEDMNLWKELEETLTESQGRFTLYSNDEDSMDVAIAMELEGIKSPVYVIENSMIDSLGWKDKETPIKLLLDKDCNIITTYEVSNNKEKYKLIMKNLLDFILKNEYKQ
ncbi:MAG: hypothetical protein ABIJ12_03155, partial [bacterium]